MRFLCDLKQQGRPFEHFWEHTMGSGHAALALRADWQAQLLRCHRELGVRHVRFHALLSNPLDTLICQDEKYLYSFHNADQIMDYLLSIGMRPFVELSFMPAALASGGTTVFHYQANVTPPRDYGDWCEVIRRLARHWVDRYGVGEVSQWYFEVWNEPNLQAFWPATQAEYFELYLQTARTLKEVDPSLRVGGPATAQNAWIGDFLGFCETHKVPADFVSTHYYPTDAFGQIGADTVTQLAHAPRHVMRDRAAEARQQAGSRPLFYTEWSISSNPRGALHDQPFAAAYATRIIMDVRGLVQGYSYWTFSDIFDENYFPSVPFQGGFGLLNIQGIAKPAYRAFELLHGLGDVELAVTGDDHPTLDALAVWRAPGDGAAGAGSSLCILLTNQAQPRHEIHTELVEVALEHAAGEPQVAYVERIDENHANPLPAWGSMGRPEYLTDRQVAQLETASQLVKQPIAWRHEGDCLVLAVDLPAQALAAVTLEFAAAGQGGGQA